MSKRKSTSRVKLKAASQEDWIQMWKEHFKNLLGNSSKVTDKPTTKIINSQQEIKLGQFTYEELNVVLTKIKSRKLLALVKYPQKYGRPGHLMTYHFDFAMPNINRIQ